MKKKVALSATAIAVLASTVPTHVAPVEAADNVVYVQFTEGNNNHAGNGSSTNPYNLFDDALRAVADGGTIIVRGTGFLNDVNNDGMPYYINKSVKIIGEQGTQAKLSVRPAGLILGGNLTLENIALDMYNSADDSIFVNGHTLTMTDVTRFGNSRLVDIFAGTYNHSSNPSYNIGSKSVINITTTAQLSGTSQFGNIYAGSMLGDFDREVEINLTNGGSVGKLQIEGIKSSGAYAPIPQNIFDTTEPDAPVANPSLFKVSKDVTITLNNMNPSVDGDTGTSAITSLKYIGKNLITINASNIKNLDLDGTKYTKYNIPQGILNNGLNKLTLSENAILDLTNYDTGRLNISTYKGTGAIALPQAGVSVDIANDFEQSDEVTLYLGSYNPYGQNGNATKNHVYFTTPSTNATINYEPSYADEKLELKPIQKDSRVAWTVVDPKDLPSLPEGDDEEELKILGFEIDTEQATKSVSFDEFNEGYSYPSIRYPFRVLTNLEDVSDLDLWLTDHDLDVTVNGLDAEYRPDSDDFYVPSLGMVLYFEPDYEPDVQELVITSQDENGALVALEPKTYNISVSLGEAKLDTTLVVDGGVPDEEEPGEDPELPPAPPEGGDGDGDGEGEDQEPPALTKPAVSRFTESVYSQVHKGQTTEISQEFQVEFEESIEEEVEFQDLFGSQVFYADQQLTYSEEKSAYVTAQGYTLKIETTGEVGKYRATLSNDGGEIPKGKRDFKLVANGKEAIISLEIKSIITEFTTEDETEKEFESTAFLGQDGQEPFFTFKTSHSHNLKELDTFEDFKVTINDEDTDVVREGDEGKLYYYAHDQMVKARIFYNQETDTYSLFLETYEGTESVEPELDKYTVKLSHPGIDDLTFTVNVKKEEQPTELPYFIGIHQDYGDGVTTTFEDSVKGVSFLVLVKNEDTTYPEEEFHDLGISIEFGESKELGVYDEDTGAYYFDNHNIKATVEKQEGGYHKLTFTQLDEDGNPISFSPSSYSALIGNNTTGPSRVEFTVTPSEPAPEPELPGEQLPTIKDIVTRNAGDNVFLKKEEVYDFTYNVTLLTEGNPEIDVNDFNFTLDGAGNVTSKGGGVYTFEDIGMTLTVTKEDGEDNKFLVNVKGSNLELPLGDYDILLGVNGHDAQGEMFFDLGVATLKVLGVTETPAVKVETDYTTTRVNIPLNMKLNREGLFRELGYSVTLNGNPLVYQDDDRYTDTSGDLLVEFYSNGEEGFEVILRKNGQSVALNEGEYVIEGTSDKFAPFRVSANLELKPPRVIGIQPGSNLLVEKTVTTNQISDGVKLEHGLIFNHPSYDKVDLSTLDYDVNLNGITLTYNEDTKVYESEETNLKFKLTPKDGGKYEGHLYAEGDTIPVGSYEIVFSPKEGFDSRAFGFGVTVNEPTPTPPTPDPDPVDPTPPPTGDKEEEEEKPSGGSNTGSGTTPEPEDKEEEKEEPTNPPSSGGGSSSGTTTEPTTPPSGGGNNGGTTNPPSGGSGNTGGSSTPSGGSGNNGGSQPSQGGSGNTTPDKPQGGNTTPPSTGGGTTLPAPDPKPEKPAEKPPVVDKPTPSKPTTKPTYKPPVKPGAVSSPVEDLEDLATEIQEKVDSLMAEVLEQAKGLILDLTGDADDLSSVSTLEVTKDGIFANVDGEKVKFATDLKLEDMSKLRIIRADGSPVPYITNGESFVLSTSDFSDILITERVVEPFVDVAKDDWFQPYVDEIYNRGVTTGTTATTFSPNDTITRAQMAALLARAYELEPTGEKPALNDISDQWYAKDVQALVDHGIIKGYEDKTFRGDKEITREQMVNMLYRLEEMQGKDTSVDVKPQFADKDKVDPYSVSALEWAAKEGIINSGRDTEFKPKKDATRAQVAKMLARYMSK